ncbi:MAG: hypothetical protein AAGF71_09010 [Pseudomonadota bacterium]
MAAVALARPHAIPDVSLRRLMADDPTMTTAGLIMLTLLLPMAVAGWLDPRMLDGEGIWVKPMKFSVSIAMFLLTLAAFARHIPEVTRHHWLFRGFALAAALAAVLEILWIGGAATLGVRSHFNESSALAGTIYGIMGLVAILLTSASLVYGLAIWRNANTDLRPAMRLAIVMGLLLTFGLTLLTAGTLAGRGALIGLPDTGAVIPILGWSLEVGDLRVSHFFATHLLQIIPLIVWLTAWTSPRAALGTSLALALFTLGTYAQALAGLPFLPLG